jgi:hypothetical protein
MLTGDERYTFDFGSFGLTLDHATALIASRRGRQPLVEHVARMYSTSKPLWSHLVLPLLGPRAVFTTNYDQLVEQGWEACRAQQHGVKPLVSIFAPGQRFDSSRVPLFKPHGSVERALDDVGSGGLVLTMIDYFEMLSTRSELLEQWLGDVKRACAIFIGYGLADMDIASHLYKIRKTDRGLHWYAVFPRVDPDVKRMYHDKFGIHTIARTMYDFLVDLDAEVKSSPPR